MANVMEAEKKQTLLADCLFLANNVIPFMKKESIESFEDGYAMWMASVLANKIPTERREDLDREDGLLVIANAYAYMLYAEDNSSILSDEESTYEDTISLMIDNKYAEENPTEEDMEEIEKIMNETEEITTEADEEEPENEQSIETDLRKDDSNEDQADE